MDNYFDSPFCGAPIRDQTSNPNIIAGKHSYYSGYYHNHSFDDCARYLAPDRTDVDKLIIGSYCSIGSGAVFMMAGNQGHRSNWAATFPFFYQDNPEFEGAADGFATAGDTELGHDVWVGSEAMIMPGVKVGNGAIIASRALVTRDVAPYAVVGGNPARVLKMRFDEQRIAWLQQMCWWEWDETLLAEAMPLLCSSDIEGLYRFWQSRLG